MIVLDSSALMALLLQEGDAGRIATALQDAAGSLAISAATLAEARIVADRRGIGEEMQRLLALLGPRVVPVTAEMAERTAEAYRRWGKANHPAALNFGDCFAYALAMAEGAPLLFVGEDFARTDVRPALG